MSAALKLRPKTSAPIVVTRSASPQADEAGQPPLPLALQVAAADDAAAEEGGSLWERHRSRIVAVAVLAVVALTALALNRMLDDVDYNDLVAAIQETNRSCIGLALAFTALSFAALSIYDRQALAFIGRSVPFGQVALTSFCAYAVGNIAGFGPLTGGTIRYRFYAPLGVSPEDMARIIGYVTAAFGFGLLAVGGLGLLAADADLAALVGLPEIAVRAAAILILAFVATAGVVAAFGPRQVMVFGRSIAVPGPGSLALQLAATGVDLVASALVLWVLLPPGAIDYPSLLSVYAVALGLGIWCHVPGGVGVFEAVILGALGAKVPLDRLVGALLLYRVIYYVVPLAVAVVLLTVTELKRPPRRMSRLPKALRRSCRWCSPLSR
jgi:phosphatidylglycerol lysyltransferase